MHSKYYESKKVKTTYILERREYHDIRRIAPRLGKVAETTKSCMKLKNKHEGKEAPAVVCPIRVKLNKAL